MVCACALGLTDSCAVPPVVSAVWPTTGPAHGSTLLSVTGTNFLARIALMCEFGAGGSRTWATYVTATRLMCMSPAHAAATIELHVSNNNQDFTTDAVQYGFQGAAACDDGACSKETD
jgi:hypothetical protein